MALGIQTQGNAQTSSASDQRNGKNGQDAQEKYSGRTQTSTSGGIKPVEDIVPYEAPVYARLIVSVEGEEKTGKDHFAFTAPGGVYIQTCDPLGSEDVAKKFPGKIFMPKRRGYQLNFDPNELSTSEVREKCEPILDEWVAHYRGALRAPHIRTIVWDTADELWELTRLAKFGELTPKMNAGERNNQYGELNGFYEGLIKEMLPVNKSLILLHRLKDEYKNNTKSGARVRAGYKDIYFLTQVNLRSEKRVIATQGFGSQFGVKVIDCRANPGIEGATLWDESANGGMKCDFPTLARVIKPEIPEEMWR